MQIKKVARGLVSSLLREYKTAPQLDEEGNDTLGVTAVYGMDTLKRYGIGQESTLDKESALWAGRLAGGGGVVKGFGGRGGYRPHPDNPFPELNHAPSFSASLSDFGLTMDDLKRDKFPNLAEAASKVVIPPDPRPSERVSLIIQQQQQGTGATLPLETPQIRASNINLANKYFLNDSTAGPAIKSLFQFVIGPGFTIDVDYTFPEPPSWFNPNNPEVADVKRNFSGKASKDKSLSIFIQYMTQRAEKLYEKLDMGDLAIDMAQDALVTGDAFCYRIESIIDDTYLDDLQPKAEFLFNDIVDIQAINPLAVNLQVDEFNQVIGGTIRAAGPASGTGTPIPDLTKFIHLKWQGARYTIYGISHLQNAFNELLLKESLLKAAKASADRFAVPIRLAQYGVMAPGSDGGPIALPAWRDDLSNALSTFNVETDTLVGPFHWDIKLVGAEGKILDIAEQIEATDRRIMISMGIPPNFLDSNYTSFATAKIQMQNMLLKLRQLQQQVGRAVMDGIIKPWAEMRGYRDPNGDLIRFKVRWHRAELESDPEMLALIANLAKIPGQRYLSRTTIRETIGVDPDIEDRNIAAEKDLDVQQGFLDQNGQPMGQDPKQQPGDSTTPTNTPSQKNDNAPNPPKVQSTAAFQDEVLDGIDRMNMTQEELERRISEVLTAIQKENKRRRAE